VPDPERSLDLSESGTRAPQGRSEAFGLAETSEAIAARGLPIPETFLQERFWNGH
jgi:hypothetical protein